MTDKCHCQKGNSPDPQLRSQSTGEVVKDVPLHKQPGCWLRSSHTFKECVIAHWSSDDAPKIIGAKTCHRSLGILAIVLVEEQCIRAEAIPRGVVDCIEERMPA